MTNNPYEPQPTGPFEAGPMVRMRRAEGYSFPPGPGHRFDKKHFRRQALMAYLFVGGVIFVAAYIVAGDLGWLPRGW